MIKKLWFYFTWLYKTKIKGNIIPLNSSIIITDKCNLSCKHCVVSNLGYPDLSYEEIKDQINKLYSLGSRMLVITGGEPFIWSDNDITIDDVVRYAKNTGFYRVVICTNGFFNLSSQADYLWVSLDGFIDEHNIIRGKSYDTILNNINNSNHKAIYINFTVSKYNYANFEASVENILTIPNIKGVFVHLFTPYINSDKTLLLDEAEKINALKRLKKLKRKHFLKIVNSFDGIKAMIANKWERPIKTSITINRGEISYCCCRKGIYDSTVCNLCGCSPAVETWVLERLKPVAIVENLRFL